MEKIYYTGVAYENYGTGKMGTVSESVTSMDVNVDSTPVYPGTVTVEMISNNPPASYIVDVTNRCTFDWSGVNTHFVGTYYSTIKFNYGQKHYSNPLTVHVVPPQTGWNTVWQGTASTSVDSSYTWTNPFWSPAARIRFTFNVTYTGSGSLSYYDFSTKTWSTTPVTSPVIIDVPVPTANTYTTLLGFRNENVSSWDPWDPNVEVRYTYDSFTKKYYLEFKTYRDSDFDLTITKIEQYVE